MNMTTPQDRATDGAYARMMQAWQWLCEQRTESPDHADIWDIRWQQADNDAWLRELTDGVLRGDYHLSPMQLVGQGDNRKAVWGAQDALVLKWAALSIQHLLPLHKSCEHVQGHGGGKQSVHKLHHLLTQPESGSHPANNHGDVEKKTAGSAVKPDDAGYRTDNSADNGSGDARRYKWVCRTDIRGYYRNINKATLINQVRQHVQSPVLRDLVDQYIHYTVEDGGTFHTPEKGISRGCPLSPLMGALHLYDMDEHFVKQKAIHYARYMDDIIILAKSRWSLRRHTKRLMQGFSEYGFEAHPDKTYIGRTEKGFDWMGAWLTHEGVRDIAPRAKANHREKVRRLYERLARIPLWRRKRARQLVNARVSTYRKRWNIWAGALLCVAGAACADSPLVILASGNTEGDTGARYPVSVNGTWEYQAFAVKWADYGGPCLSFNSAGCRGAVAVPAYKSPLGWGWRITYTNLALIPLVDIRLTGVPPEYAGTTELQTATGDVTFSDGTTGTACEPTAGDYAYRATYYRMAKSSGCPYVSMSLPFGSSSVSGDMTATGSIAAYALGPLEPGKLSIPILYLGYYSGTQRTYELSKPSAIIVSGLNCNMEVTSVTGATSAGLGTSNVTVDFGYISRESKSGATYASSSIVLKTTCSGTNSSDAAAHVTIHTTFSAGAGTESDASGFLRETGATGHYLTLNQDAGACNASKAVTDGTTGKSYDPGETGTVSTETVVASLCSDGKTPTLGTHTIRAVAKLVNR